MSYKKKNRREFLATVGAAGAASLVAKHAAAAPSPTVTATENGSIGGDLNGFAGEFLLLLGMFQRAWTGAPAGLGWQLKVIAVLGVAGNRAAVQGDGPVADAHTVSIVVTDLAAGDLFQPGDHAQQC